MNLIELNGKYVCTCAHAAGTLANKNIVSKLARRCGWPHLAVRDADDEKTEGGETRERIDERQRIAGGTKTRR